MKAILPGRFSVQISGHFSVQINSPGDIIVGDDDGVVVIPFEIADVVADRVQEVANREREIKQKLADGMTTCDIFEITT